jgi:flagellar biosynthetic protein FliR
MLTLSSVDLEGMLALFLFPLVRILAWLSFDPLLGNRSAPARVRLTLGVALAVAIVPVLPPVEPVPLMSADGILVLLQQIAIGAALGFTLRIVFAAVELAGQFIGLQMGLSFATLFDPINGAQTPVIAQFLVLTSALVLFAFNGHHLVIGALVQSFYDIPVSASLSGAGFAMVANWAAALFSTALHIALPITAALLATNLAIGMMTRASPQLNIFAIGFPLTLGAGFVVLYFTLAYMPALLDQFWLKAVQIGAGAMAGVAGR